MSLEQDPYRILELSRGATLDEVKRAYRRLAKTHHPDAAGESALPRFLAIQAAYEQLIGGSAATGGSARGRRAPATPRRPWEADPDRSDATRRAYGGRARSAPPGGKSAGPGAGSTAPGGTSGPRAAGGTGTAGAGRSERPGQASGSRGGGSGGSAGRRGRRGSGESPGQGAAAGSGSSEPSEAGTNKKATLGSTSYDGADAGPFEPDWRGASWYGTTSGTYWTLNPKEYADPRKHGPEYQARARRAARSRGSATGPAGSSDRDAAADPAVGSATDPATGPTVEPTHTTSSWWDSTAGSAAGEAPRSNGVGASGGAAASSAGDPTGGARSTVGGAGAAHAFASGTRARPAVANPEPPDLGRAASDLARALTDPGFGGPRGRVLRALVGWLPIAYAIAWIAGEVTGCGRFAATCDGAADPFVLILQVAVLGLLLVASTLASVATTAALTLVVAAVVATLVLSATGAMVDDDPRRVALGLVMLIAWLVGLSIGVVRRLRALPPPVRPVS